MLRDGRQAWLGSSVRTPFTSRNSPDVGADQHAARAVVVQGPHAGVAQTIERRIGGERAVRGPDHEAVAIETDEEAARRVLQQRPNDVPCQALLPAERRHGAVAQPHRAGLDRTNPESPFAILVHRAHAIRRESLRFRQCLDPVPLNPPGAIAVGAEPDAAVLVLQQHVDFGGRHAVCRVEAPDPVAGATNEHPWMTDPDGATAIHEERADRRGGVVRVCRSGDRAITELLETPGRPDQDAAVAVLEQRGHNGAFGARIDRMVRALAIRRVHHDPAGVTAPDGPRLVLEYRGGIEADRSARAERLKLPRAVSVQRFRGPHPQGAATSRAHARNVVVDQRGIGGVEDREVDAVEADQAFFGCQPHVTVAGLREGGDRSLRQPVAGLPVIGGVLRDERARIECRR